MRFNYGTLSGTRLPKNPANMFQKNKKVAHLKMPSQGGQIINISLIYLAHISIFYYNVSQINKSNVSTLSYLTRKFEMNLFIFLEQA